MLRIDSSNVVNFGSSSNASQFIGTNMNIVGSTTIQLRSNLGTNQSQYFSGTTGNMSFGDTTDHTAKLAVIATTEQFRVLYDASNYMSTTISSTGSTTLALTGTTPRFTFSNGITFPAGTATAGTAPLVLTSGTNLTSAIAGAMEYNGTNLFFSLSTTRLSVWCGNDAAAAPGTSVLTAFTSYYGTGGTIALSAPNSWASVVIAGTTYKVPLYT